MHRYDHSSYKKRILRSSKCSYQCSHLALGNWRYYINKFWNFDEHRNLSCVDFKCELSYREIAYIDRKK